MGRIWHAGVGGPRALRRPPGISGEFHRSGGRDGMNDDNRDLYALPAEAIKEPPHTLRTAIRQIGPGLILAASIVGTGELINTTSLGAKAGFSLLWLILLSCVIKVFVQVELGRYAITHGKTTLAAFDTLPGPRMGVSWLCWLWLIMMLTTQAQIAAMEGTVGQAAHMAFPRASDAIAAGAGQPGALVGSLFLRAMKSMSGRPSPHWRRSCCCSRADTGDWSESPPCWSPPSRFSPWRAC